MRKSFTPDNLPLRDFCSVAFLLTLVFALPGLARGMAAAPSPGAPFSTSTGSLGFLENGGEKPYPEISDFFDYKQPFSSTPVRLTAYSNSSGTITYSILPGGTGEATLSGTNNQMLQTVKQGTVLLRATVAEDFKYRQAYRDIIVTITKGTQSIAFPAIPDKTYGLAPFTISATGGGSGNPVVFSVTSGPATVAGNKVTVTGAGTVKIRATQAGNINFDAAQAVEQTFVVKKATPNLTFNNITKTFGDNAFNLAATADVAGTINYSVVAGGTGEVQLSGTGNRTVTMVKAGTVKLRATLAEQANYAAASKEAELLIQKAAGSITLSDLTQTYTGQPRTVTASTSPAGLSTTITYDGKTAAPTTAGTYALVATISDPNYSGQASGELVVGKATQQITFPALADKTYGDAAFELSASSTGANTAISYTIVSGPATVAGNTLTITGAGEVKVRAAKAGNANYNAATPVERSFSVARKQLTVTADNKQRAFGAANPAFTLTYRGFVNGDNAVDLSKVPTATTAATSTSPVGTYPIVVAGGEAANYALSYEPGVLTVVKAMATIAFSGLEQLYTGQPRTVTATTTPAGLSTTITYNGQATAPVNAGSYPVVATITDPNYTGQATAELVIGKAPQQLTFGAPANKQYGDAPFALSASGTGADTDIRFSIVSGPATLSGHTLTITGAGVVTVSATKAGDANYNAAPAVERSFTVSKKELTAQADDKQRVFGQENPTLSLTYSGFVIGDKATDLSKAPSATTTATTASRVGTYPILVAGGEDENYSFAYVPGTLTITKAAAVITLSGLEQPHTGAPIRVSYATTPAGLEVLVTYNGSTQAPVAAGEYAVLAVITNENYAGQASGTLKVMTPTSAVAAIPATPEVMLYPNPTTNGQVIISGIGERQPVQVLVHDITGRVVWRGQLQPNATGDLTLNLDAQLRPGQYFVQLRTNKNYRQVLKLVKE
ncbi:MBG domain-containing protein [Pontibacter beigongshangensis]|uniref:MBG domain-containing protein n=1 Tax=Pontibacter beigongshangensis TaxID=2574733 RepID=UPI00164EFD9B|nr:MBG domain-containing protein [Pontibacter beigongshangensis]